MRLDGDEGNSLTMRTLYPTKPGNPFGRAEHSVHLKKEEGIFPDGSRVQVSKFAKMLVISELRGVNLAGEMHLYQWPGTAAAATRPGGGALHGTPSGYASLFALCRLRSLLLRVDSFLQSPDAGDFRQLRVHAGNGGRKNHSLHCRPAHTEGERKV